ncbi:MAG: hypothetical protein BZ138_06300 [Methanosphaera sp. rholeuAM270]|nr:MAG: hypothetical protein BZ138_06300 [Methanosphaera sp. rholeuAM270]
MAFEEVFSKDHEIVVENSIRVHEDFWEQVDQARTEQGMSVSKMGEVADAGPAQISRIKNPKTNLTVNTMSRVAAAVGKKIEVVLVDMDEDDEFQDGCGNDLFGML